MAQPNNWSFGILSKHGSSELDSHDYVDVLAGQLKKHMDSSRFAVFCPEIDRGGYHQHEIRWYQARGAGIITDELGLSYSCLESAALWCFESRPGTRCALAFRVDSGFPIHEKGRQLEYGTITAQALILETLDPERWDNDKGNLLKFPAICAERSESSKAPATQVRRLAATAIRGAVHSWAKISPKCGGILRQL